MEMGLWPQILDLLQCFCLTLWCTWIFQMSLQNLLYYACVTHEHGSSWAYAEIHTQLGCRCSVAQSCLTLCGPIDCSPPGFHVLFLGNLIHPCFQSHLYKNISSVQSLSHVWSLRPHGLQPDFPIYHQLPELAQIHVYRVGEAIQPSHPLLSPSPPAFNLSQHQGLFQWVSSLNQVPKVLELQLQQQSFQWILRTDCL